MLGLGTKSYIVLFLAVILGIWSSRKNPIHRDYWQKLPRFTEINVDFDPPKPVDQSILYRTGKEIKEPMPAEASGQIPEWLKGTLLRNGPGLFEFRDQKAVHVFDGMAMIRRYHVDKKETEKPAMNISRRLIESEFLKANLEAKRFTKYGVGTAPLDTSIFNRIKNLGSMGADNVVVNTVKLFGHYYAATELPQIIEYDPVTLETLGTIDLTSTIPGIKIMTPHPLYDPDGTLWNIAFATGPDRAGKSSVVWRYVIFKVSSPKTKEEFKNPWLRLEIMAEVSSSRPYSISYLHSFFMTENYLIFTEQPWIIGDLGKMIYEHILKGNTIGASMYWAKDDPLLFHVMEKATGNISPIKYEADPMGFFHIINAYEDDGHIILDAPFKSSPVSYNVFQIAPLASPPDQLKEYMNTHGPAAGLSRRWALPLTVPAFTGDIIQVKSLGETKAWVVANSTYYLHPEYLAPPSQYMRHRAFEFGMINPNFVGRKYKFAYGMGFPTGYLAGSIMKLDVDKKEFPSIWDDPTCRATEPQFVPRPGSHQETDGVVVFVCLGIDQEKPTTSFVVLNPDLQELGRFSVPLATPVAFHGIWIS